MKIIPTIVRKEKLKQKYSAPDNSYHLALLFCMERLSAMLNLHEQVERMNAHRFRTAWKQERWRRRGCYPELEFRRIVAGKHYLASSGFKGMDIQIVPKACNSIGLQLADLVARPIGLKIMRPSQENRAFDIIKSKFLSSSVYQYKYAGMKTFP